MHDLDHSFNSFYEMGKRHFAETIWEVSGLVYFVNERGFTCDELQTLIRAIEELKGVDYEGIVDEDTSEQLREDRGEYSKL